MIWIYVLLGLNFVGLLSLAFHQSILAGQAQKQREVAYSEVIADLARTRTELIQQAGRTASALSTVIEEEVKKATDIIEKQKLELGVVKGDAGNHAKVISDVMNNLLKDVNL